MTDWKAMARALGLPIPDADLDRAVAPLEPLGPRFERLAATLHSDEELAVVFDAADQDSTE